jgi:hypothetical protein
MFKYILSSSSGEINWMALSALITFFIIFSIVIFQIIFQRKDYNKYMSELPLKKNIDHNEND